MYIIRADHQDAPPRAVAALKRGGIVVYPTETAYALGCDATNAGAVGKIFRLKKRDPSKPLPLIVHDVAAAHAHAVFDPLSRALAQVFWPGPLTLVLKAKKVVAGGAVSRRGEIALRVSAHPLAAALARALGVPIVSTSANRSGGRSPYRLADVLADFGTAPDVCLDAGALAHRSPSTIVRCQDDACEILRHGPISERAILRVLRNC